MNKNGQKPVARIITLEEHFLHPKLRELYPASRVKLLDMVKGRLTDVGPERIRHPADPPQAIIDIYYKDCPVLMQSWGWQVET